MTQADSTSPPADTDPDRALELRLKKAELLAHRATLISAGAAVISLVIAGPAVSSPPSRGGTP